MNTLQACPLYCIYVCSTGLCPTECCLVVLCSGCAMSSWTQREEFAYEPNVYERIPRPLHLRLHLCCCHRMLSNKREKFAQEKVLGVSPQWEADLAC
jgi:hypothetical protein